MLRWTWCREAGGGATSNQNLIYCYIAMGDFREDLGKARRWSIPSEIIKCDFSILYQWMIIYLHVNTESVIICHSWSLAMSVRISSPGEYANLLDKYDTWLFDCDGVLWRGDHLIEGVTEVLDMLRRRSMCYLSNTFTFSILNLYPKKKKKIRKSCLSLTTPQNPGGVIRVNLTS